MLANVSAVLGLEGLVLAVDGLHHPLFEDTLLVAQEQRVPLGSPDQLDDVPAGAAEGAFEFLDDLAVAAYRPVETLQVAVDDENQVVAVSYTHLDVYKRQAVPTSIVHSRGST